MFGAKHQTACVQTHAPKVDDGGVGGAPVGEDGGRADMVEDVVVVVPEAAAPVAVTTVMV